MKSILPDKKEEVEICPYVDCTPMKQHDGKQMVTIGLYEKYDRNYDWGFNQAIFECEAALKKAVDEACDKEKIKEICNEIWSPKFPTLGDKRSDKIADAISQRIRGCFYKEVK